MEEAPEEERKAEEVTAMAEETPEEGPPAEEVLLSPMGALANVEATPNEPPAEEALRAVLLEEGIETKIEMVAVDTDEEAQRLRFPGSPTIRVEGEDLLPVPERESSGQCRRAGSACIS